MQVTRNADDDDERESGAYLRLISMASTPRESNGTPWRVSGP
jgi:hypothetical protein